MTKRALALFAFAILIAIPMRADFNSVARAIDGHAGVKRVWIPFLGLARAVVWVAHPEGVHDFQLVTFEGGAKIDPHDLNRILEEKAGPGYVPLVRTWSRRSKGWSFIFAKPSDSGNRVDLLILTRDDEDTVLVRVDVDFRVIARELNDPRNASKVARK
ncbi:MAG TPA: hypothetical protein VJZ00_10500 [Thermoanaerobaculia bacterium]|nr:hypothetical protein [Thermoanaerobaculia bacterium]